MLSSIVILSTLAASALGSNSTNSSSSTSYSYEFPSGFDIGQVKTDELNSWCQGQRNVCPELCKGGTKQNSCDSSTLKFSCKCDDGKTPDVSQYIQTVPFYVCQATFGQCINNHPDDAEAQEACKKAATCGSKNASESDTSSSSSASASSTSMAVATSTDSSSPSSSSVAAASSTHNAAAALGGIQGISTGLMATVMFLAARLVL